MKKRLLIAALSVVMAVSSLSGCGKKVAEEIVVVDMDKDWTKEYDHFLENPDVLNNVSMKITFVSGESARLGLSADIAISGKNMSMIMTKVTGANAGGLFGMYISGEDGTVIAGAGKGDIQWMKLPVDENQKAQYVEMIDQTWAQVANFDQAAEGVQYLREETDIDGTIYDVIGGKKMADNGQEGEYEYYIDRAHQRIAKVKSTVGMESISIGVTPIDGIEFPKNATEVTEKQFATNLATGMMAMYQ